MPDTVCVWQWLLVTWAAVRASALKPPPLTTPLYSNPNLNTPLTTTDSFQRVQAIPILQIPTFHESRWFAMGTLVAVIFIVATFVYEV